MPSDTVIIAAVYVLVPLTVFCVLMRHIARQSPLKTELGRAGHGAGLLAVAGYLMSSGVVAPFLRFPDWRLGTLAALAATVWLGVLWLVTGWRRAAGARDAIMTTEALVIGALSAAGWVWLGKNADLSPVAILLLRVVAVWLFAGAATRLLILVGGRPSLDQRARLENEPGYGKSAFVPHTKAARDLSE
jgi:hypothetical protein